jgi:phosphate uptake regulator
MDELSLDMVEDSIEAIEEMDESIKYSYSELERKLDDIIDSNITEIKYEGAEIKDTMKYEINLIHEITGEIYKKKVLNYSFFFITI